MKTKLFSLSVAFASVMALAVPTEAPDNTVRYSGTVLDHAGTPVAGATVELFQGGQTALRAGAELEAAKTVTTGSNGAFEFRAPPTQTLIFAAKAGLAPAWLYTWNANDDVEEQLVLTSPVALSGVAVDDTGKPVAGAEVWLSTGYSEATGGSGRPSQYIPAMPHRERFSARTGPDGKFQINGCPNNAAFDLGLNLPGHVLRDLKRQYTSPETMRWRPGQKELKLVVEPAGTVEGKLRSFQTGEPIKGARISLQSDGRPMPAELKPAITQPDGTFKLTEVPSGAYVLYTVLPTNGPSDLVAEHVKANVAAGLTTRDIEIAAVKAGFLEVRVAGKSDQKPLPDVNLSASSGTYGSGGITDREGITRLTLLPGDYTVTAYMQNQRAERSAISVEAGKTNALQLELESPRRITGVVLGPEGKPAPNLPLRVMPEWRFNIGAVKTDAGGRFSFPWNPTSASPNETCCVVVRDVARNLAVAEDLTEETKELELRLQPGISVRGKVEDTNGKSLANATVQLFFWVGNSGFSFENKPTRVDKEGRFLAKGLPAGRRYSASATAKGYGSQSQEVASEGSEATQVELAAFVLNLADRKLAGQVVDADDKPVSGAWVHMYGQGQPNSSTRTGDDGQFKFDEVCEGSIQVSANVQGSFGNVRADAGDTNVVLKLGLNSYAREAPSRPSLRGKPLPDLASVGLPADCVPAGKPVLLCLVDIDQRPCRRFARLLSEQHGALLQKGVTVLALQAAASTPEALKEWKDSNPVQFKLGQVTEKSDKTKWATAVESLPWLILADKHHKVVAEGFALEELEGKLADAQ